MSDVLKNCYNIFCYGVYKYYYIVLMGLGSLQKQIKPINAIHTMDFFFNEYLVAVVAQMEENHGVFYEYIYFLIKYHNNNNML